MAWHGITDGKDRVNVGSNGAVDVNVQDQISDIIDLYLCRHIADITLASGVGIADYQLTLVAGHGVVVGNILCFKENHRFLQVIVTAVATNLITIDSPFDYAYTTDALVYVSEHDAASLAGTQGTPQIYNLSPPVGTTWDIVRLLFHIEDSTVMDDGTFGGMTALTNGVVLRKRDGTYKHILNVKTNGEFAQRAYDREYIAKPPAGTGHSMNVRRTFGGQSKNGVVIRLAPGDYLEVLVQDDITPLDHFHIIAQGHVVEEN